MPFKFVGEPPKESALVEWGETLSVITNIERGRRGHNPRQYVEWMEEIGFEDVVERTFYWPTNPWPKDKHLKLIAVYVQENLSQVTKAVSFRMMSQYKGWSQERVDKFLVDVGRDIFDPKLHAYTTWKVTYGRKPIAA